MPGFTTVSVQEAKVRTISGRQGTFMNEYVDYIKQLPQGQAGKLRVLEQENPLTIRRRLVTAAKTLQISLIIKRSGNDLYFWQEERDAEHPRRGRPRRGRAGDNLPPQPFIKPEPGDQEGAVEEIITPDRPVDELGMVEQGIPAEESPELGQTPI
jgi:hypothetical protein